MAALLIGCSVMGAQAQDTTSPASSDVYKPRMTKAEAKAYVENEGLALVPDNLTAKILTGDVDTIEALIVAGVDPKAPGSIPQSPLQLAVQTCSLGERVELKDTLRMVDLFIGAGVDPNHPGVAGLTALMVAAQQQCPPVVIKRLLAAGADIDAKTPQGFTPLSMALIVANYDGAEALIEAGARIKPEVGEKFLTGEDDDKRLVDLIKRASVTK